MLDNRKNPKLKPAAAIGRSMGFGAPIVWRTPVMGNCQNGHGYLRHCVNHRVRKSVHDPAAISQRVSRFSKRACSNPINGIEYFDAKGIGNDFIALKVPKECLPNIALGFGRNFYVMRTHSAVSRARASSQGTALVVPECRSALRLAISADQAAETADSSSPSRLSSSASNKADRSCGISASASSITWSRCAFMSEILAARMALAPHSPSPSPPPGEGSLEQPIRFRRFGYGLTGVASCNCSLGFAVLARGRRVRHPLTRVEVQRELGSDSNVHAKHTTGTPEGWWILAKPQVQDSDPDSCGSETNDLLLS